MPVDINPKSSPRLHNKPFWRGFFPPRSIYGWLVILLLTLAVLLFVFVALLISSMSGGYMENVTTLSGKHMATLINQTIRSSMMTEDHAELEIAINKVTESPGVKAIRIYDHNGQLKYHTRGDKTPDEELAPCDHCHDSVEPGEWGMPSTCVYNDATPSGRNMVVLSPIKSSQDCTSIGCHQSDKPVDLLGFMEIELPLDEMDAALKVMLYKYFLIVVGFLTITMLALLLFFNKRINQPLKKIVEASRAVTAGNMSIRLDIGNDDLADIYQVELALNTMLESINASSRELQRWSNELETQVRTKSEDFARTQNEIYQIERLASLGRLSSSVAHEINNPLAGILTYAKLVSRVLENNDLTEEKRQALLRHLNMIQSETARCGNIVKGLLNFSRDPNPKFDHFHLNDVLKETLALIQHSFQIEGVRLITDFSASRDLVQANGNQIIQACLAVLTNALEAVANDGSGLVTYRSYNQDIHTVTIEIRDNGIGISAEDQEHIFEPFFSRKKEMSGIGLGLAVTYGILEQHQAKVSVDSAPGMGSSFKFTFNLFEEEIHE